MSFDRWLPLIVLAVAAVTAVVMDRFASLRRPTGERGDFWARTLLRFCLLIPPALLISGALETLLPRYWQTGRHLHFDLTTVFGWSFPTCYRVALGLPLVVWLLVLATALIEKPGEREAGRWLAGAVGYSDRRRWILLCALPVIVILAFQWNDLGRQANGYPAASWSTLAVVLISLVAIALSAGRDAAEVPSTNTDDTSTVPALRPWPEALASHGIRLRPLAAWPASETARPVRGDGAAEFAAHLDRLAARGAAPELIEAVDGLLHPRRDAGPEDLSRLVFAPDDCGQTECVALAAALLEQRFHAVTLVITADNGIGLRDRLRRRTSTPHRIVRIEPGDDPPRDALIWVVDAEMLSDRLLPRLRDAALVNRIGMVVWWHLEEYTGVLGANLWAISRRLHRLITSQGRYDVRTLALARSVSYGAAQMGDFVRRLLPYDFPSHTEVHVETRFPRPVELHRLDSHHDHFNRGESSNVPESSRHPLLIAAAVSTEENWPTHLEEPGGATASEIEAFLQRPSGGTILRERLYHESVAARARLLELAAADVLAVDEIVCQGGRSHGSEERGQDGDHSSVPDDAVHHVAVVPPRNPYAAHLLRELARDDDSPSLATSRRLVCAEAHPSIIRRHLLLALSELADTRNGLLGSFLWNEDVIDRTLEQISYEHKLKHREVRYLGDDDRLVIDREYRSERPSDDEQRPLDTVGARLIAVRSQAESGHAAGVRMRVDPERLTVQAYPYRVFMSQGRRYRIREWDSPSEIIDRGWLPCLQEGVFSLTWRLRNPFIFDLEPRGAPSGFGRRNRLLSRVTVDLEYEEEVLGAIRIAPDLTSGRIPKPETLRLSQPITQSFPTRALVLSFPEADEFIALSSLCQALRHVLPVHLGIEDDALEVVPIADVDVGGLNVFGLAIVDLYPGGIGLIDAIQDDNTLILEILERTWRWLDGCGCQSDRGCEQCLRSPAALAVNSDQPPRRAATLRLLQQIV